MMCASRHVLKNVYAPKQRRYKICCKINRDFWRTLYNILRTINSTFSTIIFKWLNLTLQFESFMPDCFTCFENMSVSGTRQFHKVTYAKRDGIFSNNFIANFLENLQVKEFWKPVKLWQSYYHEFGVSFFGDTGHFFYYLVFGSVR